MIKKLTPPLLILMGLLFSVISAKAAEYSVKLDNAKTVSAQTFFTVTDPKVNYNTKYKGTYDGTTYTAGLKMQGATEVSFSTTQSATLTIVQSLTANDAYTIKVSSTVDGKTIETKPTRADDTTNKVGIYTLNIAAGEHKILQNGKECGLLYVKVKEVDASTVIAPVISAVWGTSYNDPSTVTIATATEGASIYYTIDGTAPSASSTLYSEPFTVSTACTVKAIAIKSGMTNSDVTSLGVTINSKRNISFNFDGIEVTGTKPSNVNIDNGESYTLPTGRTFYVAGKTLRGWVDENDNPFNYGEKITVEKDYTLTPKFYDNQASLGDAETTVDWTFATSKGAPSVGYEGNVGYYTQQATVNGQALDVVMTVDARQDAGVTGKRGKFNTTSADNRAQVNVGTVFIIPAVKGMTITYTPTNGSMTAADVTFAGESGEVASDKKSLTYTYDGNESTIKIIDVKGGFYPSGLKVTYPAITSIEVNINSTAGYGTLYYEKALTVPADTKAYTASLNGNTLTLNELTDGIIPAKTAVLVSGNGGLFEFSTTGATFTGKNDLKGTATDIATSSIEGGTVCTLGYIDGQTGFYKYTGETLNANKAYLVVPEAAMASAKGINIVIGNPTGVAEVKTAENVADAPIYNIAGQKVTKNAKGIVIINGKAYINK